MAADWKQYERFVSALCANEHSDEHTTVVSNAKITGAISGILRQVDVLIDKRFSSNVSRRIIVDAKRYSRKVNIADVERFESMMRDCRAEHGFLVCPEGYTQGALRRAQDNITLKLLSLADFEGFSLESYDLCDSEECQKRDDPGVILWTDAFGITLPNGPVSLFSVAKCDVCHQFHVWCFSCGARAILADEDEFSCSCGMPWFWLTAIEEEIDDFDHASTLKSVYLLFATLADVKIVDRRPLS